MKAYTKTAIALVLSILGICSTNAQSKLTDMLAKLPADYQAVMSGEMIAYDTPGDSIGLPNSFDGASYLRELTDDYLLIDVTDASTLQLKRLQDKKGNEMYVAVYTVYGPAGDSDIRFFDTEMNQLPTKDFIKLPELKDFFKIDKGCKTKLSEIEKMLPFVTREAKLSPDGDELTFTLTCEDYVNQDDYNILKLFLHPAKYVWQQGKYKLSL